MKLQFCLLTAALAAGCVSTESVARRDIDIYGTRVIRPGMAKADVDAILNDKGWPFPATSLYVRTTDWLYDTSDIDVIVDAKGLVTDCGTRRCTGHSDVSASMDAQTVHSHLRQGMAVAEVRNWFGAPAAAYENEPGTVVCVYPQPSIEVTFFNDRVKSWRFHHLYRPSPEKDIASYGTRIIRPGMSKANVDALLNDAGSRMTTKSGEVTNAYQYDEAGIRVTYDEAGHVESTERKEFFQSNWPTFLELATRVRQGMTPDEVRKVVGSPNIGYENEPGHVFIARTFPPRGGIVVEFINGQVKATGY
jgi:hypothetical protein